MGLSKFARRTENKITRGVNVANKIVGKSGQVLNTASNVLGKVSNISGKILSNPIVEGIVASNPELAPIYGGAVAVSALTGKGAELAGKGAKVADNTSNVLEKASGVMKSKPAMSFA